MMFKFKANALFLIAAGTLGCSDAAALKSAPVSVSGKVAQGGKPLANVVVWFQPLDNGHLASLPVNSDGTFRGELIGGRYAYYVGQLPSPNSAAALKKIDSKYYEPNLERSVHVEFGKEIILALD
jgi:hypothetical protein